MPTYIYQNKDWPGFNWDRDALQFKLGQIRSRQGRLLGKLDVLGFPSRQEALLTTVTLDVIKTSEIEGVLLDPQQVRSSLARQLGMDIGGLVPSDRYVDGVVEMMLDATQHFDQPLTRERLFGWQSALFPGGRSGIYKILVGGWRKDETGPMQVVSGAMGKEKIHFQAPDAGLLEDEMGEFLNWFNGKDELDPVVKAGVAHLWFITIHPFEDGNGRIARAITDMQLARADNYPMRFYSMSAQIRKERNNYYCMLEQTQRGNLDISQWMQWYFDCLYRALEVSEDTLSSILEKARFWEHHRTTHLNERQKLILNRLLDGIEGKMTTSKWAKMAKCSGDTALRDIQDLVSKGIMSRLESGGRSTAYEVVFPNQN